VVKATLRNLRLKNRWISALLHHRGPDFATPTTNIPSHTLHIPDKLLSPAVQSTRQFLTNIS
jgi:hypothetical protein